MGSAAAVESAAEGARPTFAVWVGGGRVRRCQKSPRRGPGQNLVWKEESRSAGRGRAPGRRTLTRRPAVGAVRVAGARRLQQLQQPLLVALAVAHGWPGGLSGAQPRSPLACRPPKSLSSRGQVESDAAPPPPARRRRLPSASPAPRGFRPAPGACRPPSPPARPALLPPAEARPAGSGRSAGGRANPGPPLDSCGTVDNPVSFSGLSFHLCKRRMRAGLRLWASWKIRQDLTSGKEVHGWSADI